MDAVQEFQVVATGANAEYGRTAGGIINVISKSGTNDTHGSLFYYQRHRNLSSNTSDGKELKDFHREQFGGTVGGPLLHNRSFFFGSFEGLRMQRSLTRAFSVPTAAARAGDFAGLGAICDPSSIPVTGTCAPFPGNRIPAGRIDPIAAALLEHVPLPTSPGSLQNLTAVEQQDRTLNQFSIRLDHRLSDADQLLARFSTFDADEIQPFGTSRLQETLVPGFGRSLTTRARNLVASHSRVFGRSWLNELRAGWMTVSGGQISQNQGNPFAQQVGTAQRPEQQIVVIAVAEVLPGEAHRSNVGLQAGRARRDDQHRADVGPLAHVRPAIGRRERRAIGAVARQGALVGEVGMHVPPETIELTGAIRVARALVLDHRDARQERPEPSQRPRIIIDRLAIGHELAQ